jgi:SAM-dependent methyltransferase
VTITHREGFALENPSCNICGSNDVFTLFETTDTRYHLPGSFGVVRCFTCGFVFLSPRPVISDISMYYPPDYQPYQDPYTIKNDIKTRSERCLLMIFQQLFENYHRYFGFYQKGNLLDVGCGNGNFLRQKRDDGWGTYGVEINEDVAARCREEGLAIFCGTVEEAAFPDHFFQVITMNHSLEHMYDPSGTLEEISRIIKDEGLLFLAIPNFDSIELKIFSAEWDCMDSPRHVCHFTPETIDLLLKKSGFRIRKILFSPTPVIMYNSYLHYLHNTGLKLPKTHILMGLLFPITFLVALFRKGSIMIVIAGKRGPNSRG